jgi:hypothetical protein
MTVIDAINIKYNSINYILNKYICRCMTNAVMASMNMTGKKNKLAFGEANYYKLLKGMRV